tara:strand:- start:234 stop:1187 length:954 start_codon:yes stop_codon:yes gene_type:complete
MSFDELLLPNKDELIHFFNKVQQSGNFNILIHGTRESCKTEIIEKILTIFLSKYINKYHEKQLIFRLNAFDELNLQSPHNEMSIFCQNNTNTNKIVYIDKFDFFSDSNQQLFKIYIDKYNGFKNKNKIFFIIETTQIEKVRDIIKSRLQLFKTDALNNEQYKLIFSNLLNKYDIEIDKEVLEYIVNIPNLYISTINNIINKCRLLEYKKITYSEINSLCNFIDFNLFDNYFSNIFKDIKLSCSVLIELYENGYDISDIYFYIYEYIKIQKKTELYCIVELLCFYINEIYNGNYNKIMLVIFTYEIQQKLNLENKVKL